MKKEKVYPNPRPAPQAYYCKLPVNGAPCGKLAEWQSARGSHALRIEAPAPSV